jgi:hypothetical protein
LTTGAAQFLGEDNKRAILPTTEALATTAAGRNLKIILLRTIGAWFVKWQESEAKVYRNSL